MVGPIVFITCRSRCKYWDILTSWTSRMPRTKFKSLSAKRRQRARLSYCELRRVKYLRRNDRDRYCLIYINETGLLFFSHAQIPLFLTHTFNTCFPSMGQQIGCRNPCCATETWLLSKDRHTHTHTHTHSLSITHTYTLTRSLRYGCDGLNIYPGRSILKWNQWMLLDCGFMLRSREGH